MRAGYVRAERTINERAGRGKSMTMFSEHKNSDPGRKQPGDTFNVHCQLFADDVLKNVCDLRKRELNGRGEFTCSGCSWATS